jgi:23S rRNA pseudouridine1911/1915/1917 synthase
MEISNIITCKVSKNNENNGTRLDQFLSMQLGSYSRSYIQKLIKDGHVKVNEVVCTKCKRPVELSDEIQVEIPTPEVLEILPEKMDLDIIYEDEDIILINKPKGLVVHPAPGHYSGTLVNGLLYHCHDQLSGINGIMRPGIVHRIDMNTTGVIVACKNDMAHQSLSEQLAVHSITRKYRAIVYNNFTTEEGTIDKIIGRHPLDRKKMAVNVKNGRRAVTHYKVLNHLNGRFNEIECRLETGRTHQIRVHMASIGHPLLGDDVYGPKKTNISGIPALQGQTLHAEVLGFIHPRTKKYVEFSAPLPMYYKKIMEVLGEN